MKMKKIILIFAVFLIIGGLGYFKFRENDYKSNASSDISNKKDVAINKDELKCEGCNLVIISLTNTRKDHIGLYGYERDTTPNIDKFFQNALIFENTFAPASWTLPVAVSFFTSLFPYSHGVMDRYDGSKLSDEVLTFTEILKQNGYKTAGFTGGGDYNRQFNFNQGFDIYIDEGGTIGPSSYFGINESMPGAIEWLSEIDANSKFFLFTQGFDTHCPFSPKDPFDKKFIGKYKSDIDYNTCLWTFEQTKPIYNNGVKYWPVKTMAGAGGVKDINLSEEDVRYMTAIYDGEIAQTDDKLNSFFQLIKEKDLEKNTIFIFISEHGDLFGEHGRFMRGGPLRGTFYDPVLNFPLIIKHPKINEPLKIDSLIQTVDIMPTLLDILKLTDEQGNKRQGKSIVPVIAEKKEINDYVYAASKYVAKNNIFFDGISIVESIKSKKWKLIKEEIFDHNNTLKTRTYELYDVSNDPKENHDLYDIEKETLEELKNRLDKWKEDIDKI